MSLQEFVRTDAPSVAETASISEATRILLDSKLSALPVLDGSGRYLGIFSMDRLRRPQ